MVALVQPVIETARCTKCGDVKSCDDFGKGRNKNGLQSWCKVCAAKSSEAWRQGHRSEANRMRLEYAHNLKARVFAKLGNRCASVTCSTPGGSTDIRCLQLDHVHNDGHRDRNSRYVSETGKTRRSSNKGVYQRALKDTEGRYQILCANCNTIKAWEYNQCRLLAASKGA